MLLSLKIVKKKYLNCIQGANLNESKKKNPYHKSVLACHMLFPLITRPFYHSISKTQHFKIESKEFQKSLSQNPSCLSHAIPAYHSLSLLSPVF